MKTSIRLALAVVLLMASGSPAPGQTPALGNVMREKLMHSQRILGAIMTSDYATLERESAALVRATESPAWSVLKTPEYRRQSEAFLRASDDLVQAAKQRDLDAAAMNYVSLTLTCFQCHRYVKDARIATEPRN